MRDQASKRKSEDLPTRLSGIFKMIGVVSLVILASIFMNVLKIETIRKSWPMVQGTVVKTASRGWWNEDRQRRYYLKYQYEAGNRTYENVQFHIKEDSLKRYKYLMAGFKTGDPISVWYNPKNPEESVINDDFLMNGFVILIVMTGFLVLSLSLIIKESLRKKLWKNMIQAVEPEYDGKDRLPSSSVLEDRGETIQLNTGMSMFWGFGIPFLMASFACIVPMLYGSNEINPGWTLSRYMTLVIGAWILSTAAGIFVKTGFRHTLELNKRARRMTETSTVFFKSKTKSVDFRQVEELRLYREKWRFDNPLRDWMLYIQTQSKRSLFISHRHRDIQPACGFYLRILKKRLEYVIFK